MGSGTLVHQTPVYVQGKRISIFFDEIIWRNTNVDDSKIDGNISPSVKANELSLISSPLKLSNKIQNINKKLDLAIIFSNLHVDKSIVFQLYVLFHNMDVENQGFITLDNCFASLGGYRTKFTERIYYYSIYSNDRKLDFQSFALKTWFFLTLSRTSLCRMLFEIFDPDNTGFVEKIDLDVMYKMLYDVEKVNRKCIDKYSFKYDGKISKADFITYTRNHKKLIKPALQYQWTLRNACGSYLTWEMLTSYRNNYLVDVEKNVSYYNHLT